MVGLIIVVCVGVDYFNRVLMGSYINQGEVLNLISGIKVKVIQECFYIVLCFEGIVIYGFIVRLRKVGNWVRNFFDVEVKCSVRQIIIRKDDFCVIWFICSDYIFIIGFICCLDRIIGSLNIKIVGRYIGSRNRYWVIYINIEYVYFICRDGCRVGIYFIFVDVFFF